MIKLLTILGADKGKIIASCKDYSTFNNQNFSLDLYGSGTASKRIIHEFLV